MSTGVVIVGAGAAGVATATGLRRRGYEGEITLVGAESVPPYDRPPLSKQVLAGAWDPEQSALLPPARFEAVGARWRLGSRAVSLDLGARAVTLDDGTVLAGEHVVLATGVSPRRLPGLPARARVLRTLADALALRNELRPGVRLVIVGGGFLGLEVAATARGLGAEVVVVEPLVEPLADRIGPAAAGRLARLHGERGVELRTGTSVAAVGDDGVGLRVTTGTGEDLAADAVLVAVGCVPDVDWLEGSGLRLADGVVCDERLRAADGIWAAGDVARWHHAGLGRSLRLEHRMNANEQGTALGRAIAEEDPAPFCPTPFFWTDHYETKLQLAGTVPPGAVATRVWEEEDAFVETFELDGRLTGALAWNAPRRLAPYRAEVADLLAAPAARAH